MAQRAGENTLIWQFIRGQSTQSLVYIHYANTPMQYSAIFHGCKNVNFQMKFFNIFIIFAQNIDCGYSEAVLTSTHNLCFGAKIRKRYTLVNPSCSI